MKPFGGLTPDEIEQIVEKASERAAKKVLDSVYLEIGKGVLRKAAWLLGTALLVLLAWLGGKGLIK